MVGKRKWQFLLNFKAIKCLKRIIIVFSNQNTIFKLQMKFKSFTSLFFLLILLWLNPNFSYGQNSREKQLIETIKREKNDTKKFLRMLSLGEYYKTNNIFRADSMTHVLLQKSRVFDDSLRFAALMYSAEVNEILGNQDEYFRDILACQPFLNRIP